MSSRRPAVVIAVPALAGCARLVALGKQRWRGGRAARQGALEGQRATGCQHSGYELGPQLITFPQLVPVVAGKRYAIVVDHPSAPPPSCFGGSWFGATGDLYSAGQAWKSGGVNWAAVLAGADQHFRAYVP